MGQIKELRRRHRRDKRARRALRRSGLRSFEEYLEARLVYWVVKDAGAVPENELTKKVNDVLDTVKQFMLEAKISPLGERCVHVEVPEGCGMSQELAQAAASFLLTTDIGPKCHPTLEDLGFTSKRMPSPVVGY